MSETGPCERVPGLRRTGDDGGARGKLAAPSSVSSSSLLCSVVAVGAGSSCRVGGG